MNRDDLIKHIDEALSGYFTKDGEKWTCERMVSRGGGVVIINGQRINQPGQQHRLCLTVEVVGNGDIREDGSDRVDEFVMIDFTAKEDDGPERSMSPTECIYYDEFDYFDQLTHNLFGI